MWGRRDFLVTLIINIINIIIIIFILNLFVILILILCKKIVEIDPYGIEGELAR